MRAPPAPLAAPVATASTGPRLASFDDVVAMGRAKRDIQLCQALESEVRLLRFEPGRIEFSLVEGASPALAMTLARKLQEWTGERWLVTLAPGSTARTLREVAEAREADRLQGVAAHPVVRKVLERFPGARIVDVRGPEAPPPPPVAVAAEDDDVAYADTMIPDEDF